MAAASRYSRTSVLGFGSQYGTATAVAAVRAAVRAGSIPVKEILLAGADRLDTLAGAIYGDSRYWWILAATSDIGWGLQLPTGTIIKIADLGDVLRLVA